MAMHFAATDECSAASGDTAKMMREMLGPQAVDQAIRQAISTCWMMLPENKRTVKNIEREIRRLVDRALDNLKEDMTAFGINEPRKPKKR